MLTPNRFVVAVAEGERMGVHVFVKQAWGLQELQYILKETPYLLTRSIEEAISWLEDQLAIRGEPNQKYPLYFVNPFTEYEVYDQVMLDHMDNVYVEYLNSDDHRLLVAKSGDKRITTIEREGYNTVIFPDAWND